MICCGVGSSNYCAADMGEDRYHTRFRARGLQPANSKIKMLRRKSKVVAVTLSRSVESVGAAIRRWSVSIFFVEFGGPTSHAPGPGRGILGTCIRERTAAANSDGASCGTLWPTRGMTQRSKAPLNNTA